MKHYRAILASLYFYAMQPIASALAADGLVGQFTAAEAQFEKALAGDSAATDSSIKQFEALAAKERAETPLYQAYLGATQALQGRDAWLPWTKMKATEKGLVTPDKMLARPDERSEQTLLRGVPVGLESRLVAASTSITVPDHFFHRVERGQQLLLNLLKHPQFTGSPPSFRAQAYRQAALACWPSPGSA